MPTNFIALTRGLSLQVKSYFFIIINNYHLTKDDNIIRLIDSTLLFSDLGTAPLKECVTGHSNWIILSHANIYHDILFSCFFLFKKKKKTDLKGILSDGSCFSVERRVIFLLRNVKCKDYISCQVVETTHVRLICIRRMK